MFDRTMSSLKNITHGMPTGFLLSALLLAATVPMTQIANANTNSSHIILNNKAVINNANNCDSTENNSVKVKKPSSKYQREQQNISCMLSQLQAYQQKDNSVLQHYFSYKAQAWLTYANHEYSINSRTDAGSHALQLGSAILQALQKGTEHQLSLTTDIPQTSALMRPDLWATLTALTDSDGMSAAPRELAYSEVALIWAAADQCEYGLRSAGAHFRMADRWLEQAREAYVNTHDSKSNVALEERINRYFKQYAPLDMGDGQCRGQVLPINTHILSKETLSKDILHTLPLDTPPLNIESSSTEFLHIEVSRTIIASNIVSSSIMPHIISDTPTNPIVMPSPSTTYQLTY